MKIKKQKYYEVRPGLDSLRYLLTYSGLTWLARRARKRPARFFVEIAGAIDRHVLSEGAFEKGALDLLHDVCRATGRTELMLDIGANIGNHSVLLAPIFKQVESVEPHPVLYRILEANVMHNHLAHVHCHNIGLAGEDAQGTLSESVTNHGLSRVRERSQLPPEVFGLSAQQFGTEYGITLRSTEEFIGQFGEQLNRAFIKIDVEGMEQEIVTAMVPLLFKYKPLVGFEWFTASQPGMIKVVTAIPGYTLWGIHMHDIGPNLLWRAIKLLFTGRSYKLEPIDPNRLDEVYPLALLVPDNC